MSEKHITEYTTLESAGGHLPEDSCHHNHHVSCSDCRLSDLCIPIALKLEDVIELEKIVNRMYQLKKGDFLYQYGEPFQSIFAVRTGCVKTYQTTASGKEQITGFFLPGEILGADGIANNICEESAVALEATSVCSIPHEKLETLSMAIPSLQRHLFRLMGREIATEKKLTVLLGKNTAEERVASLLLSLSARYAKLGLSSNCFRLPMSRADIGNYLGLTTETVSRVFKKLQTNHIIAVDHKELEILSLPLLKQIALES